MLNKVNIVIVKCDKHKHFSLGPKCIFIIKIFVVWSIADHFRNKDSTSYFEIRVWQDSNLNIKIRYITLLLLLFFLLFGIPALLTITFFSFRLLILCFYSFLINLFLLIRLVFVHLSYYEFFKNLQIVCTYRNKTNKNNIQIYNN